MRAIGIDEFGGPDKLRPMALPRPQPGAGEVLVRVVSAGVNPVDCEIREGRLRDAFPHGFPLVPGWDVAGVVEEFGEGATRFRKGDRVWGYARKARIQGGCYAEYVSVPAKSLARMPAKLLFEEAAAVPLAALTAWQALHSAGGPARGSTVLIHAAGGGVGHFAVQLARLAEARVVGTASAAKAAFVVGLGAEAAIDYAQEDFTRAVRRRFPDGVDLVLDTVGGETLARSLAVVKPGGRLVSIVDEPDAAAAARSEIAAAALLGRPDGALLGQLSALFDERKLRVHVQKIYPLAGAADAHRAIEQRHVQGKLVLNL